MGEVRGKVLEEANLRAPAWSRFDVKSPSLLSRGAYLLWC